MNEGDIPFVENQKPAEKQKRGRKKLVTKEKPIELKRPRGRPRKRPLEKSNDNDVEALTIQVSEDSSLLSTEGAPLAIQVPEDSSLRHIEGVPIYPCEHSMKEDNGEKQNFQKQAASACNPTLEASGKRRSSEDEASARSHNNDICEQLLLQNEHNGSSVSHQTHVNSEQDPAMNSNMHGSLEMSSTKCLLPKDVALPRVVLCLAHNGKVAWDVKWQPCNVNDPKCNHRMGYLAVLLGNGSLEV